MSFEGLVVLDAWPVVEYFAGNEPAAGQVEALLDDDSTLAVMSSVNYAEVYSAVAAKAKDFAVATSFMESLRGVVSVVEPPPEVAEVAALVKHCYHMSLGDCFAVATAMFLSSGLWGYQRLWHAGGGPTSFVELWTGDGELLCDERVWRVRDLLTAATKRQHDEAVAAGKKKVGLRAGTEKGFSMLLHPSGPVISSQEHKTAELFKGGARGRGRWGLHRLRRRD